MKRLSIIIPVYNEEKTVLKIIGKVKRSNSLGLKNEIIVIDDFTSDGTRKILSSIKNDDIKIIYHRENMGKGAAIRSGFSKCTGDIILIQDADLEYDPKEYPKLLRPIIEQNEDVVYGSRLKKIRQNLNKMYKLHYLGNVLLTVATNLLYGVNINDMETGYKAFRREVVKKIKINSNRFDFEPEITAKIIKLGFNIKEVSIDFKARKFDEGKKITWVDGIKALLCLIRYRFFD